MPTKKDIRKRVRSIRDAHYFGYTLSGDEETFIRSLIDNHPKYMEKTRGDSPFEIVIGRHKVYKQPTFALRFDCGYMETISLNACIDKRSPKRHRETTVIACMRRSVKDQIEIFRQMTDSTRCSISGDAIVGRGHVDHEVQFAQIVNEFKANNHDLFHWPVESKDGLSRFTDIHRDFMWRRFHSTRAFLRMTTPEANLKRERIKIDYG